MGHPQWDYDKLLWEYEKISAEKEKLYKEGYLNGVVSAKAKMDMLEARLKRMCVGDLSPESRLNGYKVITEAQKKRINDLCVENEQLLDAIFVCQQCNHFDICPFVLHCKECFYGRKADKHKCQCGEGIEGTPDQIRDSGWTRASGKWFCPACSDNLV